MRPPSGRQHELVFGDQRAVIVEVGAGLRSYRVAGLDIVDGYRRRAVCDGGRGQLLLPWPNRIAGGRYRFEGVDMQLPLNEPELGNAIHGLARWMPWTLVNASTEAVTLSLELPAQPGFPFALSLTAQFTLGTAGLAVRTAARNDGEAPCPFGAGAHPYVKVNDSDLVDAVLLSLPAAATLESDARGIPTGSVTPVAGTPMDFRDAKRIGSMRLDNAFTQLHRVDDGSTRVSISDSDGRSGVTVWMDGSHDFVMVYTGDTLGEVERRRRSVAIEPMTCAPDAFNSGLGLRVLQPEEECACAWGITAWSTP